MKAEDFRLLRYCKRPRHCRLPWFESGPATQCGRGHHRSRHGSPANTTHRRPGGQTRDQAGSGVSPGHADETGESCAALLEAVDHTNAYTYWQPTPALDVAENLNQLHYTLPWPVRLRIFHWRPRTWTDILWRANPTRISTWDSPVNTMTACLHCWSSEGRCRAAVSRGRCCAAPAIGIGSIA